MVAESDPDFHRPSYDLGYRDGERSATEDFRIIISGYLNLPFEWHGALDLAQKMDALTQLRRKE